MSDKAKTRVLSVRVEPDLARRVEEAAAAGGCKIGEWLYVAVEEALSRGVRVRSEKRLVVYNEKPATKSAQGGGR